MQVINNSKNQRFEVRDELHLSELQYRTLDNTMYLMHTEVPESMSGKGIASSLAKSAFAYAEESGYSIVAYCPFVVGYIKKHPEYLSLVNQALQSLDRFE